MTVPVGPGQLYLIDTSAHARTNLLQVRNVIAGLITDAELHPEYIVPSVFDKRVAEAVARDVEEAAYDSGVARRERFSTETIM